MQQMRYSQKDAIALLNYSVENGQTQKVVQRLEACLGSGMSVSQIVHSVAKKHFAMRRAAECVLELLKLCTSQPNANFQMTAPLSSEDLDFTVTKRNNTLLHFASKHGQLELCRLLIEQFGCNPHATDILGNDALYFAVLYQHIDVVDYLSKWVSLEHPSENEAHAHSCPLQLVADSNRTESRIIYAKLQGSVAQFKGRRAVVHNCLENHKAAALRFVAPLIQRYAFGSVTDCNNQRSELVQGIQTKIQTLAELKSV